MLSAAAGRESRAASVFNRFRQLCVGVEALRAFLCRRFVFESVRVVARVAIVEERVENPTVDNDGCEACRVLHVFVPLLYYTVITVTGQVPISIGYCILIHI